MKVDKKQIPQLVVLGVLVIACVGYLSFSVFGSKSARPRPAAEQAQQQPAPSAAEGTAEASQPGECAALPSGEFPDMMGTTARRDPFTPQIAETAPRPTQTRTTTAPRGTSLANLGGSVPPINPFRNATGAVPGVVPAVKDEPEFVLTGIIRGTRNVAIIRAGDTGRHVVGEGQLIDGRYKVIRVTDDGAVLVYKDRRIEVRLGGAKNAG